MYELAVQRSEAPIIFSCRFRHGSNPSVKRSVNGKRLRSVGASIFCLNLISYTGPLLTQIIFLACDVYVTFADKFLAPNKNLTSKSRFVSTAKEI